MTRLIDVQCVEQCSLEECTAAIAEIGFDPTCQERLAAVALWLRKLSNNRHFLGDLLIQTLKEINRNNGSESGYGPQAIALGPVRNDVLLRANIWPSERDQCFRASGAKTFVYGIPHDHNFSFLTSGYLGPGYSSDYYEYDYQSVLGFAGEGAGLRFIEQSTLSEDKLMLYRAHEDIHSQIPPESLSVSLNVMDVNPTQRWFDQYGFDLEELAVSRLLSPSSTEVFLRVAVATGLEEALDLAETFGRNHPSDQLRFASFEARALLLEDPTEQERLWRAAELSGNRLLGITAKNKRAALELS